MKTDEIKNIDAYIKTFPKNIQALLQKVRQAIRSAAPKSEEAIKYGMPTFMINGKNLVHFAAWKNHIGFYPTPSGTSTFKKELSKYEGAKGSVKFSMEKPLPLALVKKITRFRRDEVNRKSKR